MQVKNCRICHEPLEEVFSLGKLAYTGVFLKSKNETPRYDPLTLSLCTDCGLVQLANDFDLEFMYGQSYGYTSGRNQKMVEHLEGVVLHAKTYKPDAKVVLDIGSNDGTLLDQMGEGFPGCEILGIDPLVNTYWTNYPFRTYMYEGFFPKDFPIVRWKGKVDIITSIAMFYDLPEPGLFVSYVKELLSEEGIWILEQGYLGTMIEKNIFDQICHEHVEYYNLKPLKKLLDQYGFKVLNLSLNNCNGGSIRLIVCKDTSIRVTSGEYASSVSVNNMLREEDRRGYSKVERQSKWIILRSLAFTFEKNSRIGKFPKGKNFL